MNLVWFRRDLRIEDNSALYNACLNNTVTIAVYIATPMTWRKHNMSLCQQQWLKQNLLKLKKDLLKYNIPLLIIKTDYFSDCHHLLLKLCQQYQITDLYFNDEYEWDERKRDSLVIKHFSSHSIAVHHFHDQCLVAPITIYNKQNKPYTVFTPYKKACLQYFSDNPDQLFPYGLPKQQADIGSKVTLFNEWPIEDDTIPSWLKAGADSAQYVLNQFISKEITRYKKVRDIPQLDTTSRLSPYFAIGVLSVRQCINALLELNESNLFNELLINEGNATWISELIWRDFYKMICYHFPRVSRSQPFKLQTNQLQWHHNPDHFQAWCDGQTGVPIIDAAMRQLNQTGWMHNRLRMIVAMYLSKNLWLDWRLGEAYFASKLVDWDFSANNGGWQWSASTGTDAVPYFRIFNPITQSERFDPDGIFIKKYCPELKNLSAKEIHNPYQHNKSINYPKPLVDLKSTRLYAIEQFKHL